MNFLNSSILVILLVIIYTVVTFLRINYNSSPKQEGLRSISGYVSERENEKTSRVIYQEGESSFQDSEQTYEVHSYVPDEECDSEAIEIKPEDNNCREESEEYKSGNRNSEPGPSFRLHNRKYENIDRKLEQAFKKLCQVEPENDGKLRDKLSNNNKREKKAIVSCNERKYENLDQELEQPCEKFYQAEPENDGKPQDESNKKLEIEPKVRKRKHQKKYESKGKGVACEYETQNQDIKERAFNDENQDSKQKYKVETQKHESMKKRTIQDKKESTMVAKKINPKKEHYKEKLKIKIRRPAGKVLKFFAKDSEVLDDLFLQQSKFILISLFVMSALVIIVTDCIYSFFD